MAENSTGAKGGGRIICDDRIDFIRLFHVLWGSRKFFLLFTASVSLISVVYALMLTPLYKSAITLYPYKTNENTSTGQLRSIASTFGFALDKSEHSFYIPDIIKSRGVRTNVLYHKWKSAEYDKPVDLITYWGINAEAGISLNPVYYIKLLVRKLGGGNKTNDPQPLWEEIGLKILKERVFVHESLESDLIQIDVWMEDPVMASDIANYISEAIIEYTVKTHKSHSRLNLDFIEKQKEDVNLKLEAAENKLTQFRERNRNIVNSPQMQLELERLLRDVRIQTEIYITLQQQYELSRIEEIKETPSVVVLDRAKPPVYKGKPNRKMIVVLGFVASMMLSLAIILGRRLVVFNRT